MGTKNSEIDLEGTGFAGRTITDVFAAQEEEQYAAMIRTTALDLAIRAAEPMFKATEMESVHEARIIRLAKSFEARLRGTDVDTE